MKLTLYCLLPAFILKLRFNSVLRPKHQGSTAEFTVVQQPYQGVCTNVLYYRSCLNFLWLLSFFQEKESSNVQFGNERLIPNCLGCLLVMVREHPHNV